MAAYLPPFLQYFLSSAQSGLPRPGLHPIPGTTPVTATALLSPIAVFYVALLLLAPSTTTASPVQLAARTLLAVLSLVLFARLPLAHHVPMSIGLTYQLGLVGVWGATRVLDLFFIGPLLFGHVPRRVFYRHTTRDDSAPETKPPVIEASVEQPDGKTTAVRTDASTAARRPSLARGVPQSDLVENMTSESYTALLQTLLVGPGQLPVRETQHLEPDTPRTPSARAAWALELALSMRGVGFSWTTADVRHAHDTWLPTAATRMHALAFHVGPVLLASWAAIRYIYLTHLAVPSASTSTSSSAVDDEVFNNLPLQIQLILTAALGAFLMAAFSAAHHAAALTATPLAPGQLAYFPPLYPAPVWAVSSVRSFWSRGWHRLFARLFLVFGVWPGEALERHFHSRLHGVQPARADAGKVLGAFASSAAVHAFAVRGVLAGRWEDAGGEAVFFALNGVAVLAEGVVQRAVRRWRRANGLPEDAWWDGVVGRLWWVCVLLGTGRHFARGWTRAGLVREMAFM